MVNSKILLLMVLILSFSINLLADERVKSLEEVIKAINSSVSKNYIREDRLYNYNKSKIEDLMGGWKFTYNVEGKTYIDEVSLDEVTFDSSMGYIVTGTNKVFNQVIKYPIICLYIGDEGYDVDIDYVCTTIANKYYLVYAFNKNGNYLDGSFGISDSPFSAGVFARLDAIELVGTKQTTTVLSSSNSTTSDNIYVIDLKNKTHSIGWYFWMSDSGKAYLASSKYGENGDISVWNFTNERKWRPIYNASAFDGYASAKGTFSNVYFSTDKRAITFGTSLLTNEFTTDLANKTHNVGWYFWMSDSNKAYLANGRDSSKGVAIWNFTDERKWRPVHNTDAFDGYEEADKVFSSVSISSDGTSITIK